MNKPLPSSPQLAIYTQLKVCVPNSTHAFLYAGDILLACSDGLWSGLGEERLASLGAEGEALAAGLRRIGEQSVRISSPHSDNTSAVALRMLD